MLTQKTQGGPVDPTAENTTRWTAGTPRNALVARGRIDKGEEIMISYHMDQQGNHKTKCLS